ncbi:Ubiquitin C-terminal hydrolase 12 [Linum grandiflorum]
MTAKHQLVSKTETVKFRWRIEKFSTMEETKLYSDAFVAGGHKWRIIVYPKGNHDPDFLSLFLQFVDSNSKTMPGGCIAPAHISLTIVNQLSADSSLKRTFRHSGQQGKTMGFSRLVQLGDMHPKGFVVDDTLVVEAEVSTEASSSEAAVIDHEDIKPSLTQLSSQVDNPANANGNARSLFSPASVQLACRNLISELSTTISNPASLLQQQKEKLVALFGASLETLSQTKLLDEAEFLAQEILNQTTDPLEKTVLQDLLSCLAEFKETVPSSLSTIETSRDVESSIARSTKDLDDCLVRKKGELTSLEAEVSGLEEERVKLDAEIRRLLACRAKIIDQTNCAAFELEKVVEEASGVLDELKKQHEERQQVGEKRMRAMDDLARSNGRFKLFKEKLGW